MKIPKIKLSKRGIGIVFLIMAIGIGSTFFVVMYADSGDGGISGTPIDLSFDDRWVVSRPRGTSGIFDEGEYIKIYNNEFYYTQTACLYFDAISRGYFRFQLKSPDLTKIRISGVQLRAGANKLFEIKRNGILTFTCYGASTQQTTILDPIDTEWYTVEIEFTLNGVDSEVSVKLDGDIVVDKHQFSTSETGVDNIILFGARYRSTPNLMYLKLEDLISKS